MKHAKLGDMTGGWFVGDFEPTVFSTKAAEVAVKEYAAGDHEEKHCHKIATEITLIVSGEAEMNGHRLVAGDIVILEPGEGADFRALAETTLVAVKVPSVKGDKYLQGQ